MDAKSTALVGHLGCLAVVIGSGVVMLACSATGTGSGRLASDPSPVNFSWTSEDGGSTGTMSALTARGLAFRGPFRQLKRTTIDDELEPSWMGWRRGWDDWGGFTGREVSTDYTNQVVADLKGPEAQRLRCKFTLNDPLDGLAGGGKGTCRFDDGGVLSAVFPRA